MLKTAVRQPDHEEAFLQRYTRLRLWARRLVQNDPQQAEDLLHDVFLQFTVSHPDLKAIENLDGYLHTMLRNMHLSHLRRLARMTAATRSLLDYESASAGLETLKRETEAQARDELRRICEYALVRKDTSKIGSVLILRFFHGYYPAEIAQLLREARGAVDQALSRARTEAKAYLSNPDSLSFMAQARPKTRPSGAPSQSDLATDDLLLDLRDSIFSTPSGSCLPTNELASLFGADAGSEINCARLAHLVSCRTCLDGANQLLKLPPISARYPTKTLNKDKRSSRKSGGGPPDAPGGAAGGGGDDDDFMATHRQRVKELLEHHPQELRIAVNGFVLGTQSVTSELSNQALSVNLEERVSFVEVFSDQEVRLAFCGVEPPPDGPAEYRERVELSDGRRLELSVDFADSRPQVNVTYRDPTFRAVPAPQSEAKDQNVAVEALAIPSLPSEGEAVSPEKKGIRAWSFIRFLGAALTTPNFWLRPSTVTALVALLIVGAAVLIYRPTAPPALSAADILHRAATAEDASLSNKDQVLHRTLRMEERRVSEPRAVATGSAGELIASRRIEVWQGPERGVTARRLYDDRGALIAGDWRRADGVQTLYHHGQRPQIRPAPGDGSRESGVRIRNLDDVWELSPSAKEFSSLIANPDHARVEEKDNSYIICAESAKSADVSAVNVLRATLTLSKNDLHATEQTITIRQGEQVREYRFIETSFERRPTSAVAPAVFEPDPELLFSSEPGTRNSKPETNLPAPGSQPLTPALATPALEVEVLQLLNSAGAFMGEQLSVTQTPEGKLLVTGVVDAPERKAELLRALAAVRSNKAVRIEIETAAEAQARQAKQQKGSSTNSGSIDVSRVEATEGTSPVYADLRRTFNDDEARRFADRVLSRSLQARSHALALKQLAQRFSQADLQTLSSVDRDRWLGLLRQHAEAYGREIEMLRRELQLIFPNVGSGGATALNELGSDAQIQEAARRLYELSVACDEGLRQSFALSANRNAGAPVKSSQFWQSFAAAQGVAAQLRKAH